MGLRVLVCTSIWHFCAVNAKVAMDPLDDWICPKELRCQPGFWEFRQCRDGYSSIRMSKSLSPTKKKERGEVWSYL